MDIFKLKYYLEVFHLSFVVVMTYYEIPVRFLLGDTDGINFLIALCLIFWIITWFANDTFHELLKKWDEKKK